MKNQKIIVVGLGISGISILDYFVNTDSEIYAYDMIKEIKNLEKYENKNIKIFLGQNPTGDEDADIVYVSPVVNINQKYIQKFISKNITVTGEIELAYNVSKSANFIGITGTNGKTTTTSMVGEIYKLHNEQSYIVGNIGNVALNSVLSAKENSNFITELSSFQLETIIDFKPHIAAILNITPDHLERHISFNLYKKAKYNIYKNQTNKDYLVLNKDDKEIQVKDVKSNIVYFSMKEKLENGVYYDFERKVIVSTLFGVSQEIIKIEDINLIGNHNIENTLAAITIALLDNININTIKTAIKNFQAVKHRLQKVRVLDDVMYINDSKATNVDSTVKAIEGLENNIILIAGGYDKNVEFDNMIKSFDNKVKKLILFGSTKNKIKDTATKYGYTQIIMKDNLKNCIYEAKNIAKKGDTVLLSPACASWDMYDNYEVRGEEFIDIVNNL